MVLTCPNMLTQIFHSHTSTIPYGCYTTESMSEERLYMELANPKVRKATKPDRIPHKILKKFQ